jgi:hypothetical protein
MNISSPSVACNIEMSCQNKGCDFTIKEHILQQQIGFTACRAIAQADSRRFLKAVARVQSQPVHVVFVVDKMALGEVFYEYSCFPLPILIPLNAPSYVGVLQ